MNPELWPKVRSLFEAALQLPEVERAALLDRDAGRATELRTEVERLLRAEPQSEGYLEPPSAEALEATGVAKTSAAPVPAGTRIGGYEIVRPIGYGGMGTVYEALQTSPRRKVALKVLRWGLASPSAVRRFRYESELLARLQHPGIAQIYEAGVLHEGIETPWFAMEYVANALPLCAHAERARLGVDQRLALMLAVCAAVHHGHQRGVIHRDLKPANILVDAEGHAKVIDFGVARATDAGQDGNRPITREGGMVGTPHYMSPEQVTGGELDVRTDVYSLGAVLYELLTGCFPFDLAGKSLAEKGRILCEQEPLRPSARDPRLARELDWITSKAMAKDPERRYGSVQELMADLQRFLGNEPLQAGPPKASYHLKKFLRRHRVAVLTTTLVAASLVAGLWGTALFAIEADEQRQLAEQRLVEFDYLASLVRLRAAEAEAARLVPPWPQHAAALERWLADRAEPLLAEQAHLRAAIDRLRARALPAPAERLAEWRAQHPRSSELDGLRRRVDSLRKAEAIRAGTDEPAAFAVADAAVAESGLALARAASRLTHPARLPSDYGREGEGLALARLAVDRTTGDERAIALAVLGWALHSNGLDEEAQATAATLLAGGARRDWTARSAQDLEAAIRARRDGGGARQLAAAERELAELSAAQAAYREWQFGSASDQFLHDTLADLVSGIEDFGARLVPAVRERLQWARRLQAVEQQHCDLWQAARAAIRAADGAAASALYAAQPIDLAPQPGLVPIGMNPATKLWEFYDLRSAKDPGRVPAHGPDGALELGPDAGIVFVLLPGGAFWMGSGRERPNQDRWAVGDELPLHEVTLAPFLLARTEMTQGQWRRLSGGRNPSSFQGDCWYPGRSQPVDESHPVEQVSWNDCVELLAPHGLALPTEAQWEYACRAGTETIWHGGNRPEDAARCGNLLVGQRVAGEYFGTLPVGSFAPNAFGLFDVHGNVEEWCADARWLYMEPTRAGDGLREQGGDNRFRVVRGGSYQRYAVKCRSAERDGAAPDARHQTIGLRPARPLL
jgi:formylglycine-generating enzyme required for sulfatase activity